MKVNVNESESKSKKIDVTISFSDVKWPLLGDIFIIGSQNPLGKNAAIKIADLCNPGCYLLKEIEGNQDIEALLINKAALAFLNEDEIAEIVIEQLKDFSPANLCLKADLSAVLVSKSEINLKR